MSSRNSVRNIKNADVNYTKSSPVIVMIFLGLKKRKTIEIWYKSSKIFEPGEKKNRVKWFIFALKTIKYSE